MVIFNEFGEPINEFAYYAEAVDISSTDHSVTLPNGKGFLYVGGTGNVKVDTAGGNTVTFTAVPVGILPVIVTKVYKTGTTASDMVVMT